MADPRSDWRTRLDRLPGWRAGLVLDVRPAADFAAGHLRGSVSHPLPTGPTNDATLARDLPSILLPSRHAPLLVVAGRTGEAEALVRHLAARGRDRVDGLALAAADLAVLPPDLLATGSSRARLWSPPAALVRHRDLLPPPALGPALDLGCGSGRACVWLAERGYRVTGIDHQSEALELGARLAAGCGVACTFVAADLRRPGSLPPGPWGLVTAFRYLERPLLARLENRVVPGGVVCVRTFADRPGYGGHPGPRHRLARGELTALFAGGTWEILVHEDGHDDDGRPAAGIVARRRGPVEATSRG